MSSFLFRLHTWKIERLFAWPPGLIRLEEHTLSLQFLKLPKSKNSTASFLR
jgi:hypothetical protein